ncbi:MAG: ATP synthase F1 subunit epsilon [Acidocella sp. 20-57-95]|nr:MAG: ATP synthase F1 subunit epsilon [Acidocella sp. 20-57-95]HQT65222.1 ATP synthase F1 subunit epsilon [Acidocella sp.]
MPLTLEIISPEKLLLSKPVDMVVIPGTEGDLGVLPGHANLITGLRGGLVDLYENGKITDRYFVSGGFAEVTGEHCAVLADSITKQSELNAGKAAEALVKAQADYAATDMADSNAYREASDKLISAQAMVDSVTANRADL